MNPYCTDRRPTVAYTAKQIRFVTFAEANVEFFRFKQDFLVSGLLVPLIEGFDALSTMGTGKLNERANVLPSPWWSNSSLLIWKFSTQRFRARLEFRIENRFFRNRCSPIFRFSCAFCFLISEFNSSVSASTSSNFGFVVVKLTSSLTNFSQPSKWGFCSIQSIVSFQDTSSSSKSNKVKLDWALTGVGTPKSAKSMADGPAKCFRCFWKGFSAVGSRKESSMYRVEPELGYTMVVKSTNFIWRWAKLFLNAVHTIRSKNDALNEWAAPRTGRVQQDVCNGIAHPQWIFSCSRHLDNHVTMCVLCVHAWCLHVYMLGVCHFDSYQKRNHAQKKR